MDELRIAAQAANVVHHAAFHIPQSVIGGIDVKLAQQPFVRIPGHQQMLRVVICCTEHLDMKTDKCSESCGLCPVGHESKGRIRKFARPWN